MATTSNFNWPTPDDTDLVRDGAEAIRDLGNAIDTTVAAGYRYVGTRYYTSSGTFAKADPLGTGDIGLRAIRVRMVGAGGGGGGAATTGAGEGSAGSGGGGGGYAEAFILATSLSATETVTRGGGGNGAVPGTSSATNGTSSSFGTLVVATGGDAGSSFAAGAGDVFDNTNILGGIGTAGDILFRGGGGGLAGRFSGTAGGRSIGGEGGESAFGGRTPQRASGAAGNGGNNGENYGTGGGGAANAENQGSAINGGNGANGIVIVDCYV